MLSSLENIKPQTDPLTAEKKKPEIYCTYVLKESWEHNNLKCVSLCYGERGCQVSKQSASKWPTSFGQRVFSITAIRTDVYTESYPISNIVLICISLKW